MGIFFFSYAYYPSSYDISQWCSMVYHLCLSPRSSELCICGCVCTTEDTNRSLKPGIAKPFLGEATINIPKLQTEMLPPHSVIWTALGMVPCACRRQGCSCPNPYRSGEGPHGGRPSEKSVSDPSLWWGGAVDGGGWVAPGAECCSGEYKKAGGQKASGEWVARRAGRCRGWCEDAGGHMLSSLCLLHLLGADGLQQSSRKSGHCFKALTQSCLRGLYMFVRGWKQTGVKT